MEASSDGTSLFLAVSRNDVNSVIEVLGRASGSGSIDEPNEYGHTALTVACWHGYGDICRVLIDRGADVNSVDQDGDGCCHWACGGGHAEIVSLLLEAGASPNIGDQAGQTALHWAASNGHIKVVRVLLDHPGIDLSIKNAEGEKPCDVASNDGIRRLLLDFDDKYGDWDWQVHVPTKKFPIGFDVGQNSTTKHDDYIGPLPYPAQLPVHPIEDVTSSNPFEIALDELEFGARIGIGVFGEVFRATWHGTVVAVKRLIFDDRDQFRKEVEIIANLRHPRIVQFLGATTTPPLCLVTEYMPKGNLYDILHSLDEPLPFKTLLNMALDVALGLAFLHAHSPRPILHRDLKSPNLLVDEYFTVKVADFGYTRVKDDAIMSQCGTPQWMSPEMLRGEKYDEKCDVYSYGIILWELLTRRKPYEGSLPPQVVGLVAYRLPGLRPIIPVTAPKEYASLIRDCWAEDPRLRPAFNPEIVHRLREMMSKSII